MDQLLYSVGTLLHFSSLVVLIKSMRQKKNCVGLSYRTQEIFLVVFITRYYDSFLGAERAHSFVLLEKIALTLLTVNIIYLMRLSKPICMTYDRINDCFPHYRLIYPGATLLTLVIYFGYCPIFFRVFSIALESLAIVPQLFML